MVKCPKCKLEFKSDIKRKVECWFCKESLWKKYPRINIVKIHSSRMNGSAVLFSICMDCFEEIKV